MGERAATCDPWRHRKSLRGARMTIEVVDKTDTQKRGCVDNGK